MPTGASTTPSSPARPSDPSAFGGALTLAWCTQRARGTIEIDPNVFVPADRVDDVLGAMPGDVVATVGHRDQPQTDGQTRLWWGTTPVDLFLDTTPFHRAGLEEMAATGPLDVEAVAGDGQ